MTKVHQFITLFLVAVMAFSLALFVIGCDKTTDPAAPNLITDDLFPLVLGRKITFSGYLRQPGTPTAPDTNITATGAFYESRWTVTNTAATVPGLPVGPGGTAAQIVDSVRVNPAPVWVLGGLYIQRSSLTGTSDISYLTSLASFYRIFFSSGAASGTSRSDSLRFVKLVDYNAEIGSEYTCYDSTYANATYLGAPVSARLWIYGKVEGTETLTLNATTFVAYKVVISRRVYVNGAIASTGMTATVWVQPNVGPVKLILTADDRNYGHYREFKSKNF